MLVATLSWQQHGMTHESLVNELWQMVQTRLGGAEHRRLTQTKQPPENPGRFNLQFPPNTQTPPSQDQIRRKTTFKVKGSFYTISQKIKQAEKDIEMTRDRLAIAA